MGNLQRGVLFCPRNCRTTRIEERGKPLGIHGMNVNPEGVLAHFVAPAWGVVRGIRGGGDLLQGYSSRYQMQGINFGIRKPRQSGNAVQISRGRK